MDTGSLSRRYGGRGVNQSPPASAEVKERVDLYIYSTVFGLRGLLLYNQMSSNRPEYRRFGSIVRSQA